MALVAVAGTAKAGATDTSNDYLSLDRELTALANTLNQGESGVKVNAWIKTAVISQDSTTSGTPDTLGTQLAGVRLNFSAKITDTIDMKISIDGAKGTLDLKDAYGKVKLCETANLTMGQFRAPVLVSSSAADEKLVFFDRTAQGSVWKDREPGVMFDGKVQQFRWSASAQNGGDGVADEMLFAGHVAFDVLGAGIIKQEAGFGTDAETALTVGATYLDEGTLDDGAVVAFEVNAATGPVFVQAELVDYDKGFTTGAVPIGAAKNASGLADTTPFDVTAAYMFNPNWEGAVRFQDADDTSDTSSIGFGVNYYVKGHDVKWQLNVISTSSDNTALDTDKILLGLVLAV
ncbi:MAG: OprO/OprP family phosphate-selective porin [Planctomycetes bacterium]|nr:OprO/OprP family phosphate-selective porin [Planctomycetota bacterium]